MVILGRNDEGTQSFAIFFDKLRTEVMPDDNVRNNHDYVNMFETDHIFIDTCD